MQVLILGGLVNGCADIKPAEIDRRIRLVWVGYRRFKREPYEVATAPFTLKVHTHAKGRGGGNDAVAVAVRRGLSARDTSHYHTPNGTPPPAPLPPPPNHWFAAPTTHRPPPAERHGLQEDTMRERRETIIHNGVSTSPGAYSGRRLSG